MNSDQLAYIKNEITAKYELCKNFCYSPSREY